MSSKQPAELIIATINKPSHCFQYIFNDGRVYICKWVCPQKWAWFIGGVASGGGVAMKWVGPL